MPYTNVWNVTDPAGTEQAKNIDDHIRKLRLDVQERMNSLVTSWSADPVVLNDVYTGKKTGLKLLVPSTAWTAQLPENSQHTSELVLIPPGGSGASAPVVLPVGSTITLVEVIMTGSGIGWSFRRRAASANPAASTVIGSGVGGAGTLAVSSTAALAHVVAVDDLLYVFVNPTATAILAARVTYNSPRVDA